MRFKLRTCVSSSMALSLSFTTSLVLTNLWASSLDFLSISVSFVSEFWILVSRTFKKIWLYSATFISKYEIDYFCSGIYFGPISSKENERSELFDNSTIKSRYELYSSVSFAISSREPDLMADSKIGRSDDSSIKSFIYIKALASSSKEFSSTTFSWLSLFLILCIKMLIMLRI